MSSWAGAGGLQGGKWAKTMQREVGGHLPAIAAKMGRRFYGVSFWAGKVHLGLILGSGRGRAFRQHASGGSSWL